MGAAGMPLRLGHRNEPTATRLLLLVLALIAGLVVVASQLRAIAISAAAHAGRPSITRSPPAAAADIAGPSSTASSASSFGTDGANGGRDSWHGHSHGDGRGRGRGWGSSRGGLSGPSPMAHWPAAARAGIAHRGSSAELPEHTREAYELAVAEGADFIECDVVLTADLVPLCRHEPNLINSTDAVAKFPERWRNYVIDGEAVAGIFSVDLTAAEVATLRAIQPWPFRNQSYNGRFRIATLADYLDVALVNLLFVLCGAAKRARTGGRERLLTAGSMGPEVCRVADDKGTRESQADQDMAACSSGIQFLPEIGSTGSHVDIWNGRVLGCETGNPSSS
ncbi:hypothetical protein VaNZ11_013562 [Volvox africanus]|uniref:glycerophosphodiester phosphodiesterase n=1 Tax=Volvox africanus TaxID=51714 RepID=A0ABQ5SHT3_9CHLO|nr:hypothetical protein VaNZ11_013562 [Volvox africanus]